MEATQVILTRNKTTLQDILMPNINFVIQCVFEEQLVVLREYNKLKNISNPYSAATELVDTMIEKGETTCRSFLCLLQGAKLTELFPLLKIRQQVNDQLKSDLRSLQDNRNAYKNVDQKYNDVVQHNKKQVVTTEKQIKEEFEKMHQFLRKEEKTRLAALREEEEQKGKIVSSEMKIIQEKISSLSDSISAVEQELQKHSVSFLSSGHKRVQCKLSEPVAEPQLVSGALIDVAKHLENLTFRVWEKMKEKVKFTPVILDPNTAHPWLCLSEDLTSVRRTDTWLQLPDNPERFTQYAHVLGSEGFSSGKHSWEVEVGEHTSWNIGLAKESIDRKGEIWASPPYGRGLWFLCQRSGEYSNGDGKTLQLKRNPQRIRVQLDYDSGEVSFYDPEDMTHIYTYELDTFTEKLFPFIAVGNKGDNTTTAIKVCQVDVVCCCFE